MSKIFIDRPIFAWVIAIIIMLGGIGAIISLPVAQYPDVAPTQISVRATYPGASAETLESSVTQVIEETLTGLDGLLYFSSSSSSRGQVSISVVFDKSIDADIAQVQVQNKVQQAIARLPQQVQQQQPQQQPQQQQPQPQWSPQPQQNGQYAPRPNQVSALPSPSLHAALP